MNRDLLLEIGTEELPASFMNHALSLLPQRAEELLRGARVGHASVHALGTPRRLALIVEALAETQSERSENVMGPSVSVAFDKDQKPTKAALAFAAKLGIAVDELETVQTEKGAYVAGTRHDKGGSTEAILPEVLAQLCRQITFPKMMRWGQGDIAFGRPLHWLVALYGDAVVPFEFAGLVAGRTSRGHRFLAPDPLQIRSAPEYVSALRSAHVVVSPDERTRLMVEGLENAAASLGGTLVPDAFLEKECSGLVEEPHALTGRFDDAFLALPEDVIVAVMRGHQRYFAVRDARGKLLPNYLNVVNTALDPETIRRGNDRVLRARLADAQFFVNEDLKLTLEDRLPRLEGVVFQAKLGSMASKVRRIEFIQERLAEEASGVDPAETALAARLCKADLVSLIVGEFPELEGIMGSFYAARLEVPERVADAIASHYQPRGSSDTVPQNPVAAIIAVADRADTLVGCFSIGLVPTGSADPFALRRATLGILRIALEGPIDFDVGALLEYACDGYLAVGNIGPFAPRPEVMQKLSEFVRGRLRVMFAEGVPALVVDACLEAWDGASVRDLSARIRAVDAFRNAAEFESLAVAFKRAYNIAKNVEAAPVDPALLSDPEEKTLAKAFGDLAPRLERTVRDRDYPEALALIGRELRDPIDRFFEKVFVMVDDAAVRQNRLRLLANIATAVRQITHFELLAP